MKALVHWLVEDKHYEYDIHVVPRYAEDGCFHDDMWSEAMDEIGWPTEPFRLQLMDSKLRLECMEHNTDEGWFGIEPVQYGLYDYSGKEPKLIKKLGE